MGRQKTVRSEGLETSPAPWGTLAVVAVCVVVHATMWVQCRPWLDGSALESLYALGGCRAQLVAGGALSVGEVWLEDQWWRTGTAVLLHGSWLHLCLNVWSLLVVGPWVERGWGTPRMLLGFMASGWIGSLFSIGWGDGAMVVGASGGIMGLAGWLWFGRRFGAASLQQRLAPVAANQLAWALGLLLALGWLIPVVAQAGHVGGLVAGLFYGVALRRVRSTVADGLLVGVGIVAFLGVRGVGVQERHALWLGYHALDRGEAGQSVAWFERALRVQPEEPERMNALAYALAEEGRELDRAEALVRGALELAPDDVDMLDTLGWILCRRGEVEAGRALLQRALDRAENPTVRDEIDGHIAACEPLEDRSATDK